MKIVRPKLKASHLTLILGAGFVAIAINPWSDIDHQTRTSLGVAGIGVIAGPTGEIEKRLDQSDKDLFPTSKHGSKQ